MKAIAVVAPILMGKVDEARRFGKELMGPRHSEMDQSRKALGQTRETVWIHSTPQGDMLTIYLEGRDSTQANKQFAASNTPFDRWFKEQAQNITGVDWSRPIPEDSVELLFDTTPDRSTKSSHSLAVGIPVLPGKTEDLRRWGKEASGPRSRDLIDFVKRAGLSRAALYLHHTPMGDFAIQYSEGENPAAAYQLFSTSDRPFEKWAKEQLASVHGVDFSQPLPGLPELLFDWQPVLVPAM